MAVKTPENAKDHLISFLDLAEVVIAAAAVALILLTFVCRVGFVSGSSMESTMRENDTYIVSNLFYTPARGDIVVFEPDLTNDPLRDEDKETLYVKRVIGTEGDHIEIKPDENGDFVLYVNGEALDEPYLDENQVTLPRNGDLLDVTVPEGYFFALGDNRLVSKDSRSIGCIDCRRIIGKIIFRLAPLDVFGTVE